MLLTTSGFSFGFQPTLLEECSSWRTQAEALKSALNHLSHDPSSSRLAEARESLTAFQSKYPEWMRLHALDNPYQVR